MLEHFPQGGYRFLASPGRPFSAGVIADPGHELVHAVLLRPQPLEAGLDTARRHLERAGRPLTSLAAFELRIPAPLSPGGFDEFNAGYVERLRAIGLAAGDRLPAARTNVAPTGGSITEPSLYAFTYTIEGAPRRPAFLLSGSGETDRTSVEARLESIVTVLEDRLAQLGVGWEDVSATNFYGPTVPAELSAALRRLGPAATHGYRWYPSRPPLTTLEYELDARGTGQELIV